MRLRNILLAIVCALIVVVPANGQGRHNGVNNNRPATGQRPPASSGARPTGNPNNRPARHHGNSNTSRNQNNLPTQNYRNDNYNRPNNKDRYSRGNNGNRYGHSNPPARPRGHRRGFGHGGPHYGWVPPPPRPWSRPVPPPRWRPRPGLPVVGGILGLTFGTALNVSINYLTAQNYVLQGYDNNVVVLTNVPFFNYYWPQGRLIYNNGMLGGSQFIYSSPYYDVSRYNSLYNNLLTTYGNPVDNVRIAGGWATTWFGSNNGFITLRFEPMLGNDGRTHYYTTLSVGN